MKQVVLTALLAAAVCTTAVAQNKVKNVYASSTKLNIEQLQDSSQPVQLNRYLFAGYNTLCLPMSLTASQLSTVAKNLKVERLAGIRQEGSQLNLYFVDCTAEGVQAGVPYLIYSPTAQYLRVKTSDVLNVTAELKTLRMSDNQGNTVSFGSSWQSIAREGRYGIPAQQPVTPLESVLVRTDADKTFLPTVVDSTGRSSILRPPASRLSMQPARPRSQPLSALVRTRLLPVLPMIYRAARPARPPRVSASRLVRRSQLSNGRVIAPSPCSKG